MPTIGTAVLNMSKRAEKMVRGTVIGCASRIIKRTPVDQGTLRGNWQMSIGQPISTTIDREDKSGSAASSEIAKEGQKLNIGAVFYMSNNLPYAAAIEFGSSKQAPEGMMRIEVLETAAAIQANRIKD
jgi:predicted transcriptional regulator YdeE